jgi:uncharacterized protein (DUF427 family)
LCTPKSIQASEIRWGIRSKIVWTYESPYAAVADIRNYLAFYPDRVDAIEEKQGG